MLSRREVLASGVSALAAGLLAKKAWALQPGTRPCPDTGALPWGATGPVLPIGTFDSTIVDGLPFYPWWTGDDFLNDGVPFHHGENMFPNGKPPAPSEDVDVAVIGGGMSGLATALLLERHRPVVFELRNRYGGVAMGESWLGTRYSLGGAYFIAPDAGTFLEEFYRRLGVNELRRVSENRDPLELNQRVIADFFHDPSTPPEERAAYTRYAALLAYYVDRYPDIPLDFGADNQWILDLDQLTFQQHVEQKIGPVPPLLRSMIQSYFFSSFGAGWEAVSAASGWNFVAAEEYGRWVLPGGNSGLVTLMHRRLAALERRHATCPGQYLRAGCRVVDVRLVQDGVQVTYKDPLGVFRSLRAKKVAMCCSKHIVKYMLPDLNKVAPAKLEAMNNLTYCTYLVANILIDHPYNEAFYDLYMLWDGDYPAAGPELLEWNRMVDVVNGIYARPHGDRTVLTCYWPEPFGSARVRLLAEGSWMAHAASLTPRVRYLLTALGIPESQVTQIRMTRWGHASPIASPNLIQSGVCKAVREPIMDRIYFVNQDNWALPAVETCLLEAAEYAPQIAAGL